MQIKSNFGPELYVTSAREKSKIFTCTAEIGIFPLAIEVHQLYIPENRMYELDV